MPNSSVKFVSAGSVQFRASHPDLRPELRLRQQPKHSRACGTGKHVNRRPIDPPPILSVVFYSESSRKLSSRQFWNPHLFIHVSLVSGDTKIPNHFIDGPRHNLVGNIVNSLEGFVDEDGDEKIFVAFGDLSIRIPGIYRLRFTLFEYTQEGVVRLGGILSDFFEVFQAKKFLGMQVSTPLCQLLAGQGMKLRVRKDARFRCHTRQSTQKITKRENQDGDLQSEENSQIDDDKESRNDVQSTYSYSRPQAYAYPKHYPGSSRDLPPSFIAYPPLTVQLGNPEVASHDRFSESSSIVPRNCGRMYDFTPKYMDAHQLRGKMTMSPDLNNPMTLSRPPVSHLRSTLRPSSYSTASISNNEIPRSSSSLPSITEFLESADSLRYNDKSRNLPTVWPPHHRSMAPLNDLLSCNCQYRCLHQNPCGNKPPLADPFNQYGRHRFSPYDRVLPRPSAS